MADDNPNSYHVAIFGNRREVEKSEYHFCSVQQLLRRGAQEASQVEHVNQKYIELQTSGQ